MPRARSRKPPQGELIEDESFWRALGKFTGAAAARKGREWGVKTLHGASRGAKLAFFGFLLATTGFTALPAYLAYRGVRAYVLKVGVPAYEAWKAARVANAQDRHLEAQVDGTPRGHRVPLDRGLDADGNEVNARGEVVKPEPRRARVPDRRFNYDFGDRQPTPSAAQAQQNVLAGRLAEGIRDRVVGLEKHSGVTDATLLSTANGNQQHFERIWGRDQAKELVGLDVEAMAKSNRDFGCLTPKQRKSLIALNELGEAVRTQKVDRRPDGRLMINLTTRAAAALAVVFDSRNIGGVIDRDPSSLSSQLNFDDGDTSPRKMLEAAYAQIDGQEDVTAERAFDAYKASQAPVPEAERGTEPAFADSGPAPVL